MNNDLISRSALKEKIEDLIGYSLSYDALLNAIENAPTVEAVEFEYHSKLIKQAYQKGKDIRPQGEWIDYDNTFYKCPDCGYLLEKCCPQCQNKVVLPKGGAE